MLTDYFSLFALGFSSLFPLINPVGTAIILDPYFAGHDLKDRKNYSLKISTYSFFLGLATLFIGSWCLKFMGVSVATTQLAGGLLIARMGLGLLSSEPDSNKSNDQTLPKNVASSLFYPMSFPLTLGPGGISTLITLSAHAHHEDLQATMMHTLVLALSLFFVCLATFFCYTYSGIIIQKIGNSGSLIVNRLSAFLVFCIGVQMTINGLKLVF
jgi:multiple antibiotic resistance protein